MTNLTLKEATKRSGLRKDFIADTIGVSQSQYSKFLANERTPSVFQAHGLADLFTRIFERKITVEELFPMALATQEQPKSMAAHV
jgi:transcriptional regulator with XRE-family HTH domain